MMVSSIFLKHYDPSWQASLVIAGIKKLEFWWLNTCSIDSMDGLYDVYLLAQP